MINNELASLDILFLVKELREKLVGGFFKKVYQYDNAGSYEFIFEIFAPGNQTYSLFASRSSLFLSSFKKDAPQEPPMFCMLLRKHLSGERIRDVRQHKFDRVVEIETGNNFLIFELFSKGNVILCDSFHRVIMPLEFQRWKDRDIIPKQTFKYPPSGASPFETDLDSIGKFLKSSDKNLIAFLAASLGFGKEYASEICFRSKLKDSRVASSLSTEEVSSLLKTIHELKNGKAEPTDYVTMLSTIKLHSMKAKKPRSFQSISDALDKIYLGSEAKNSASQIQKEEADKQAKVARIEAEHKKAEVKWSAVKHESKSTADTIYTNYTLVKETIEKIKSEKESGKKWEDIKKEAKPPVKEIRENEGKVFLEIGGDEIVLDITKSIEENAASYYEESKKARRKEESIKQHIGKNIQSFLEKTESKKQPKERPKIKERKKWHEKFRWFISSTGFLVVAGRNAVQNEAIVKKHAEPKDILYHADIHGAAFVLVKSSGKQIDPITIKEASEFSAACSKAWARGIGAVDVYAFTPNQVSKPGNEPKGSFVVSGQKVWFKDVELKLSIGIQIDRAKNSAKIISGPVMAIRKYAQYFVTIEPGYKEPIALAAEIKNKIILKSKPEDRYLIEPIAASEFHGHMPSGKADLVG